MENASKALLMAGGLLISILVVSFMVFTLRKAGQMSAEYDSQKADQAIAQFNGQFEAYAKENNTFFDVITATNLAWDVNKKNGWDENNSVKIYMKENTTIQYSVLPNSKLQKNYFFEGEDTNESVYIYNTESGTSIIDTYTARKSDNSDYSYKFTCTGQDSVKYNPTTGKVQEMTFEITENN